MYQPTTAKTLAPKRSHFYFTLDHGHCRPSPPIYARISVTSTRLPLITRRHTSHSWSLLFFSAVSFDLGVILTAALHRRGCRHFPPSTLSPSYFNGTQRYNNIQSRPPTYKYMERRVVMAVPFYPGDKWVYRQWLLKIMILGTLILLRKMGFTSNNKPSKR